MTCRNQGFLSAAEYRTLAREFAQVAKRARYAFWHGEPKPVHSFDHMTRGQYWEYIERVSMADACYYRNLARSY